jgi:ATP-dependent Lon protease
VLEAEPVEDVEEGTYGSLVKHDQHNISTMPPVLAFPFSNRPLFPGVYQPCEVTHDGLVAALVAAKVSSNPYVAVFLPRPNPETGVAPELTNITDPSEVHEVGTLAQITRLTQTPRGVQILLLGGRRVTMQRVVQNTPVMLAKVAEAKDVVDEPDAGPSLAKAYAMEVMQTIKEILKLRCYGPIKPEVLHALRAWKYATWSHQLRERGLLLPRQTQLGKQRNRFAELR